LRAFQYFVRTLQLFIGRKYFFVGRFVFFGGSLMLFDEVLELFTQLLQFRVQSLILPPGAAWFGGLLAPPLGFVSKARAELFKDHHEVTLRRPLRDRKSTRLNSS